MTTGKGAQKPSVAVIGAGAVGLPQAILLLERGYRVTLYTDAISKAGMPSFAAPAIVQPYSTVRPEDMPTGAKRERLERRWAAWTKTSWKRFARLAKEDCGVRSMRHTEVLERREPLPFYYKIMRGFEELDIESDRGMKPAWRFQTFGIEMGRYMRYLMKRFKQLHGRLVIRKMTPDGLEKLEEDAIVNCAGVGAMALRRDNEVRVGKGLVLVMRPGKSKRARSMGDGDYCWVTHSDMLKIGCGYKEGDISARPDAGDMDMMVRKSAAWSKTRLAHEDGIADRLAYLGSNGRKVVKEVHVGIFATRKSGPRVEASRLPNGKIIVDNYGHGYCGVTYSWGAAAEAADILERELES